MAKQKNPPCIRNLDVFKKTGCPQKCWDGEEGCSAWIEMTVGTPDNPNKPLLKKMCIDLWQFDFSVSTLGVLEGNQRATESFRNGMVEVDSSGQMRPKADPAIMTLLQMVHDQIQKKQIQEQYEARKHLEKEQQRELDQKVVG